MAWQVVPATPMRMICRRFSTAQTLLTSQLPTVGKEARGAGSKETKKARGAGAEFKRRQGKQGSRKSSCFVYLPFIQMAGLGVCTALHKKETGSLFLSCLLLLDAHPQWGLYAVSMQPHQQALASTSH
eukprot:1142672-Pelagomonas_calceolata.AAC.3